MGVEKKYRFNDEKERYHVMNRLYLISAEMLLLIVFIFLVLKMTMAGSALPIVVGNMVIVII